MTRAAAVLTGVLCLLLPACSDGGASRDESPDGSEAREGYLRGADGVRIFYRVLGSGPDTAVVVHGGPGAGMQSVLPAFEPLADEFTLLRGTAADPVATCREYEALQRRLARLRGEETSWEGTTCAMPPEAVRYYYRYTAQLAPRTFGDWDFTGRLGAVEAPVLVVAGARDSLHLAEQRRWASAFLNGSLLVVAGGGKGAVAESPDLVLPMIAAFLHGGLAAVD